MFDSNSSGLRVGGGLVSVCVIAVIAGSSCDRGSSADEETPVAPQATAHRGPRGPEPADLLEAIRRPYRPGPDARFLAAMSAVDGLATGDVGCRASAEWTDGSWSITCGSDHVADVAELPDFEGLFGALVDWTRQRCGGVTTCVDAAGEVDPSDAELIGGSEVEGLIAVVERVDARRRSGSRTQADLDVAASALARATAMIPDDLDALDDLRVAALTTAALSAAGGGLDPSDEVLVAYVLGYEADAASKAARLPIGGPRILATGEAVEPTGNMDRFGQWANTLTLVRRGADVPIPEWLTNEGAGLTSAWIRLVDGTFDDADIVSAWTLWTALEAARRDERDGNGSVVEQAGSRIGWTVDALSEWIDVLSERLAIGNAADRTLPLRELSAVLDRFPEGDLLPAAARASLYRAVAFAGLRHWGNHLLHAFGSVPAARAYADDVASTGGPVSDAFVTWFGALVAEAERRPVDGALAKAFEGIPGLGGLAVGGVYDAYAARQPRPSTELAGHTRTLFRKLDSRPEHRIALARAAWRDLHDLALTDRLLNSASAESAPTGVRIWAGHFDGDQDALRSVISDVTASPWQRARAIATLVLLAPDYDAGPDFETIARTGGPSTGVLDAQVGYLEEHERYDEALAAVDAFLVRPKDTELANVVANALAARVEISAGRPEDAWRRVEPLVDSWQYGVMLHGARALAQLGRYDDADGLADRVLQRYPDARSKAAVARIHWAAGRNDRAADVIAGGTASDGADMRREVAPAYIETFADSSTEDALAAFNALADARLGGDRLLPFAYAAAGAERWELAARMLERVVAPGQSRLQIIALAYKYRSEAFGDDAAMEWLRGQQVSDPAFEMYAYQNGLEPVLWDLVQPGAGAYGDYTWLERAAAAVRNGIDDSPYADRLREHYAATPPAATYYHTFGRFLLGTATVEDAFAVANSADRRCEIAYFAGIHYEVEGDLAAASDWYRVAVETGQTRNGEYHWANDRLTQLYGTGRSLAYLAEHPDELR